eukprot:7546068-Alexandrium_andersonii.AAC.1
MAPAGRIEASHCQRPRLQAPDGQPSRGGRHALLRPHWRRSRGGCGRASGRPSHRQPLLC